jgi:hypothetical protein
VALWLRFLDVPLLRHAPIVRRLVPAARLANPVEAAAAAAQAVGQVLQDLLAVLHFWGDLSGISTGPQILDRIGTAVVTATKRPAVRLLVFGGFFLLVEGIAELLGFSVVEIAARYLGLPILILGSTCLVLFLLGRWFKRIAGEALDVYLRTADAHFFLLLKGWKLDRAPADIARLARSVFLPERKLRGDGGAGDQEWLAFLEEPIRNDQTSTSYLKPPSDPRLLPFAEDREVVTLLYRDFLDGPILHREDDKTSVQLLGNLEIQEIRLRTLGLTRKDIRKLEHLDLVKERLLSLGPYFWFRFISESLAIETAKLVMEYNTSCIPLARLPLATPAARRRFESFLESHRGRWDVSARETGRGGAANADGLLTDDFTALCFLGADPALDDKIARRFGEKVLAALRRDRRGVVRDIFGTRPYHLLPRERRVINPYRLYHRYLGGAKVFLLPFVVAFACVRAVLLGLGGLLGLVQEVLGRKRVLRGHASRAAGFGVAVRKINRMRKPFFMEALRLRAAVDIEYLGLRLPGCEGGSGGSTHVEDLDFVGAVASERRPIEALRAAAVRDLRRFRNFLAARGWLAGGMEDLLRALDPGGALQERRGEVVRALVTAYITDHDSLRSLITARGAARAFVEEALERRETAVRRLEMLLGSLMVFLPRVRRGRRLFREYVAVGGDLGHLSPRARRKALRRFLWAGPRVERSLALAVDCARRAAAGEDAILQSLRGVARDYASWTRKIVTLRSIQAITVLDIQAYRDLVWKVGAYAEDGV